MFTFSNKIKKLWKSKFVFLVSQNLAPCISFIFLSWMYTNCSDSHFVQRWVQVLTEGTKRCWAGRWGWGFWEKKPLWVSSCSAQNNVAFCLFFQPWSRKLRRVASGVCSVSPPGPHHSLFRISEPRGAPWQIGGWGLLGATHGLAVEPGALTAQLSVLSGSCPCFSHGYSWFWRRVGRFILGRWWFGFCSFVFCHISRSLWIIVFCTSLSCQILHPLLTSV